MKHTEPRLVIKIHLSAETSVRLSLIWYSGSRPEPRNEVKVQFLLKVLECQVEFFIIFFSYTEDIWIWDQKTKMRWHSRFLASMSWYLQIHGLNSVCFKYIAHLALACILGDLIISGQHQVQEWTGSHVIVIRLFKPHSEVLCAPLRSRWFRTRPSFLLILQHLATELSQCHSTSKYLSISGIWTINQFYYIDQICSYSGLIPGQ